MLTVALAAGSLLMIGAGGVKAQSVVVSPPAVSYYSPPPAVPCYSLPVVYTPRATVSYYYAPSVSYYTPSVSYYPPSLSYYAPSVPYYGAPAAVTTTRYGVFGRPRVTTAYYPSVYVGP
jgi:hypothetical protein